MQKLLLSGLVVFVAVVGLSWAQVRQPSQQTPPPQIPQRTQPAPGQLQRPDPMQNVRPRQLSGDRQVPVYLIDELGPGHFTGPEEVPTIPPRDARHDADGDSDLAIRDGGHDCDDNNPNRNSRATETAGTTEDDDCNARTVGDRDADNDGYISWAAMNVIRDAGGGVVFVTRGSDCDDHRRDVNPGMIEVLGNDRDDNCDGFVDSFDSTGHSEYCGPTSLASVAPNGTVLACGESRRSTVPSITH